MPLICNQIPNLNLQQELFFLSEMLSISSCKFFKVSNVLICSDSVFEFKDLRARIFRHSFTLASIIKIRPFLSDFSSIICKDFNLQKPMATPQEFVLSCEKNKGPLKSCFHFLYFVSMRAFLAEKQNRYGAYYSLDIKRSLIPLTLLEITLLIVLDVTSFFNRQKNNH